MNSRIEIGAPTATEVSNAMSSPKLAILVDGENISPELAEDILQKASPLGIAAFRLVFGDFERRNVPPWNSLLTQSLGYEVVSILRAQRGSNTSDEAICLRALELTATGAADAICVASNDGDFSGLADQLKDAAIPFYVLGTPDCSKMLRDSCTEFLLLGQVETPCQKLGMKQLHLLRAAVLEHADKRGWAKLQAIDRYLRSRSAPYRKHRWGFASITKALKAAKQFELRDFPDKHRRARISDEASRNSHSIGTS